MKSGNVMVGLRTNVLYYGDNLDILREHIPPESIDLIYLDPPFNSNRSYNVLFHESGGASSEAQIEAFEDTWRWGPTAQGAYEEVMTGTHQRVARMLQSMVESLGHNDVTAYLSMMAIRLVELHRVLKDVGSIYLHCDPTAGPYLRVLMDSIFDPRNLRNEIVWKRTMSKGLMTRRLPQSHDVILAYQKSDHGTWNSQAIFSPYDLGDLDEKTAGKYGHRDSDGRLYQLDNLINPNPNRPNLTYEFLGVTKVWRWTKGRMQAAYEAGLVIQPKPGAVPRFKRYLDEQRGRPLGDVWTDIPPINSQAKERLGYPTQKPLALLERIISASSNPGDIVLDPFCGCGTAVHAAQKLGRRWIGIDITYLAINLIERRMTDAFPGLAVEVEGAPKDFASARDLAQRDKYQFQWWALTRLDAQPVAGKKKGSDKGIDGVIPFFAGPKEDYKRVIVSVKGGEHVNVVMVRDLKGVLEREKEPIGILLTLTPPTKDMVTEAAASGFYDSEFWGRKFPRLQIMTIEEMLGGKKPDMPWGKAPFAKAPTEKERGEQEALL
ncbi:MAG: site-specific DNA-methyltransferase [Dehalococcoidia bacterium]|nr:site-specific DNA-methyltransferase [Dehalococcoidia bacterium]